MKSSFLRLALVGLVSYATVITMILPTNAYGGSYSSMSCYGLWYSKNKIFADNGYCFETRKAINAFGRRCYYPYGRLSGWQKDEVNNIKYWERQKGCNGRRSYTPSYSQNINGYARVTGIRWNDTLAVRSGPSTSYRRIGDLAPDATNVRIIECTRSRQWCKIEHRGLVGWSFTRYLRSY